MASKKTPTGLDAALSFMNTNAGTSHNNPVKEETAAPIRTNTRVISAGEVVPEGYKVLVQEKRTRRVGFIMTPTNYARLEKHCKDNGVSMSEFINQAIAAALDEG